MAQRHGRPRKRSKTDIGVVVAVAAGVALGMAVDNLMLGVIAGTGFGVIASFRWGG